MKLSDVIKLKPKRYQIDGIKFMLKTRYVLNGCSMGLGKTLMALTVAFLTSRKILIVVPKKLMTNWGREIKKVAVENYRVLEVTKPLKKEAFDRHDIFLVSYTSFEKTRPAWKLGFDCVICDEAHYLKSRTANRTLFMHEFVEDYKPKRLILLSGTPVLTGVPDTWAIWRLIWLGGKLPGFHRWRKAYWAFCDDFCRRIFNPHGKFKYGGLKDKEGYRKLIAPCYIRMRASDHLDLPTSVNRTIWLDKKFPQEKLLLEAWENYLDSNEEDEAFATLKAKSALFKVPATQWKAEEILETGESVVIFTVHRESAEALHKAFPGSGLIMGGMNRKDRDLSESRFNSGKTKVLIGTIGAMREGLNLQERCNYMVFNDMPWTPAELVQARARIRRLGQKKRCFYFYMMASEYDKRILKAIIDRITTFDGAVNV